MSWWSYVEQVAKTSRQRDISDVTGIDATNVTRWKNGTTPGPSFVAQFARAYKRPVLESFVAAGFLTEAEAKARPAAAPDYSQLTNDELLKLVSARMREEVTGNAEHPAATKTPGVSPGKVKQLSAAPAVVLEQIAAHEEEVSIEEEQGDS